LDENITANAATYIAHCLHQTTDMKEAFNSLAIPKFREDEYMQTLVNAEPGEALIRTTSMRYPPPIHVKIGLPEHQLIIREY
jgi:hypothetical protein